MCTEKIYVRMEKGTELVEIVQLTVFIKKKNLSSFVCTWKPLLDFLLGTDNETLILACDN